MIPVLEPSSGERQGSLKVPPLRFRPLIGPVTNVALQPNTYARSRGITEAQKAGLRYEAQVQTYLQALFGSDYLAEPSIYFDDNRSPRMAKPDGLLRLSDRNFLIEIKHQHVPEAWWQLGLYKAVLEQIIHGPLFLVEICRSYDPATPFPCEVMLFESIEDWVSRPRPEFGVFQWRR